MKQKGRGLSKLEQAPRPGATPPKEGNLGQFRDFARFVRNNKLYNFLCSLSLSLFASFCPDVFPLFS